MNMDRRGLLKGLLAGWVLGVAGLFPFSAWAKKYAVRLARVPKLNKVGGWAIIKVKKIPVLLVLLR